jgi:hypothetical protein
LFLLVEAALAGAQGFEDLAFAISLMVFGQCLLAQQFELANLGMQFLAEALCRFFAQHGNELEFRGGASGGELSASD